MMEQDGWNVSSTVHSDTTFDDIMVITIWSSILIYAFITNTLTLIGIFRSRKMRQATSYWIVASLAVCDWFMIIISLSHIIPSTHLHEYFVEINSARTIWAMFMYNVFWYTGVIQLAAMAVNRLVSIVFPLDYKRLFSPTNTLLILVILYLLGFLASLPALFDCCYVLYDHHIYVTVYSPLDSGYMWLDIFLNTISVITMILCYTAILITVRKSSIRRRRYQLATKTGNVSRTVLLIATATATSTCTTSAATTRPLLPKRNPAKRSMETLDEKASASVDQRSHSFMDCGEHPQSLAQRRRSLTTPNLFATNKNSNGTVPAASPEPSPALAYHQRQSMALAALQRPPDPNQQARRREIKLFVQFFVVSLVFLSTWVTWQWLPRIPDASKWIYFGTTTFFFINNAVNPTVYLIFNTGLRHEVKQVMSCHWAKIMKKETNDSKKSRPCSVHAGGNGGSVRQSSSSDE